ncbi:MAG TPA: zinc-binding dehydrogenase [Chloroflexota bacterium]|nr:zinc-binding dehydrogenase [Chloroflexota bacterium]
MKALVKTAPGPGNLEIRDIPEPVARPGHVVIEVIATGICGTDIHIQRGEYNCVPPVVLGHELVGRVADIGSDVTSLTVGDRVITETYFRTCGRCRACLAGQLNLCPERRSIGTHVNGGFTRYVLVPAIKVHRLPDSIDDISAALTEPLACCVHGVLELAGVIPGDLAVLSGPGAIGLLSGQVAKSAGATLVVVGTKADEGRLELARQLGADHTLVVGQDDIFSAIDDLTGGLGADLTIEAAGAAPSVSQCLKLVRRGGTFCQIGLFEAPITIEYNLIPMHEIKLVGSFAQVPSSWRRALSLIETGLVKTAPLVSSKRPITEWESAFGAFFTRQECKMLLTPVT